jgi:hypothetical protein
MSLNCSLKVDGKEVPINEFVEESCLKVNWCCSSLNGMMKMEKNRLGNKEALTF